MRYSPALLDEIRARLPVSAVVGRKVKLTKAGREYKGLSPFNAEKSPSFTVNDQKGFYHCFSSGRHGDIFRFLVETEGVSFLDAVERLAEEAGVALPKATPESIEQEKRRLDFYEIMEEAARFYEQQLREKTGEEARRYLLGRDLRPETQAAFRMGYASAERFGLRDYLANKGIAKDDMIELGLLTGGEDIAVPYDRFRERVMFPIMDARGKVIAFGGRAMRADQPAKYLNSKDTPLFHKGETLYNLHKARAPAHEKGGVIVVEGYVDCIAMTRAGFPNVVAPLGTALTDTQLQMLWRITDKPLLCFDGDRAGKAAAYRAIDNALPRLQPGKSLAFAFMPSGLDPDDLLRTQGAEAVGAVLNAPRQLYEVLFQREFERQPLTTPEDKAGLERRLKNQAFSIQDENLRRYYLDALIEQLREKLGRGGQGTKGQRGGGLRLGGAGRRGERFQGQELGPKSQPVAVSDALRASAMFENHKTFQPREVALVLCAIHQPQLLEREAETLASLPFHNQALVRLVETLLNIISFEEHPSATTIREALIEQDQGMTLKRLEESLNPADAWAKLDADAIKAEAAFYESLHFHINEFSNMQVSEAINDAENLTEEDFERLAHQIREKIQQDSAFSL